MHGYGIVSQLQRGDQRLAGHEFEGLLINTNTAIVVEAKPCVLPRHVELVLAKASFLLRLALEFSSGGRLQGITGLYPCCLATTLALAWLPCAKSAASAWHAQ